MAMVASSENKLCIERVRCETEAQPECNKEQTQPARESSTSSFSSSPRQVRPDSLRRTGTYPESASQVNNSPPTHNNAHNVYNTHNTNSLVLSAPRTRNRSPLPRSHLRTRSHASSLAPSAPPIVRAHSLPTARSADHLYSSAAASPFLAPTSPMRSPSMDGTQSPVALSSPFYDGAIESISEDAELDLSSRSNFDNPNSLLPVHATLNSSRTLAVRRQRPTSPLHCLGGSATMSYTSTPRSSSGPSSPSLASARFQEGFPTLHHMSSTSSFSSVSSTPSSARSRSPSISSLDTIEDAPDLEWEAIEADRIAKLRAETEAAENADNGEPRRRGSLEIPGTRPGAGFGFGRRGADVNRKRWSICGGERRADLDLETIWED